MAQLFVSYASTHREKVAELASDLASLGHDPWYDRELTGGQAWWAQILQRIRGCDAFIIVVTRETLESEACRRELAYAQALQRPLLPIRLDVAVDLNHVPPEISTRQLVDYGSGEKSGILNLNKALQALPEAPPLPDPPPRPPPVPISYVAEIIEEIRRKDELGYDEQVAIVFRLRDHLATSQDLDGVRSAYETLLKRRELYAKVRDEIHQILTQAGAPAPPPPTTQPSGSAPAANHAIRASAPTEKDPRGLGCGLGALSFLFPIVGLVLFAMFISNRPRAGIEALVWAAAGLLLGCFCGVVTPVFLEALVESSQPQYQPMYRGF